MSEFEVPYKSADGVLIENRCLYYTLGDFNHCWTGECYEPNDAIVQYQSWYQQPT
jgi:hypothetical protein